MLLMFLSGGVGCRDPAPPFLWGCTFFALVIDGFGGMCILVEMITSSETFDDLTITTYDNDKIYIECAKPITTEVLRERLATISGFDTHQRGGGTSGNDARIVHDSPQIAGDSGNRLQD